MVAIQCWHYRKTLPRDVFKFVPNAYISCNTRALLHFSVYFNHCPASLGAVSYSPSIVTMAVSGSGLTRAADLIVFGLPAPPQGLCTSSAWFPRVYIVLGPRLFIMYSVDLADKAVEHDVCQFSRLR